MIPQQNTSCPFCNQPLPESTIPYHIHKCKSYPFKMLTQIKETIGKMSMVQLKMLATQLNLCQEKVDEMMLEKCLKQIQQPNMRKTSSDRRKDEKQNFMMEEQYNMYNNIITCNKCNKKYMESEVQMIIVEECWHQFCHPCLKKHIKTEFVPNGGELFCMVAGCPNKINDYHLKKMLGEDIYENVQKEKIRRDMGIIACVKCSGEFSVIEGKESEAPKTDEKGTILTKQQKEQYAKNRILCPIQTCKTEQCKKCHAVPFHTGYSCQDWKNRSQKKKCRFCGEVLVQGNKYVTNIQALSQVCGSKQCKVLADSACTKILKCGHPCPGVRGQIHCLPCLNSQCCKNSPQMLKSGQTGDDYCNICFIQSLSAAPCIQSNCGHLFHEKCLQKRYQIRWLTPRIIFNYCKCPLCNKWITVPQHNKLYIVVESNLQLFHKIESMSVERLKFQGSNKDQKLTDPKSIYYGKQNQYAMAIYAYFQCFKCKKPYFGGRKNCMDVANAQNNNQAAFKAQQLVCPNCCEIPIQNCPKHGVDFIEFKCKFCCSTAQWFCFGTTHFCQPCHRIAGTVMGKARGDLPKCQGPKKCPIGGNHGQNGDQKPLGCAICRSIKSNNKNF